MSCTKREIERMEEVLAYASGKLEAGAAARFRAHMAGCPECSGAAQAHVAVSRAMDAWLLPPVSADFDRRLFAKIEAANAAPWYQRFYGSLAAWMGPVFARPALPLAGATLAIVLGFALDHPGAAFHFGTPHSAAKVMSEAQVDQVEATLEDLEMLHQFDNVAADSDNTSKSM